MFYLSKSRLIDKLFALKWMDKRRRNDINKRLVENSVTVTRKRSKKMIVYYG